MESLFHGGPVDGGTFPAEIWGTYMKAARRGYCKEFPKPNHPFKTKAVKRNSYNDRANAAPVQPVAPLPPPRIDPGAGRTKPGGVQPPRAPKQPATPPPPPPTGGNGYDPGSYQAPPPQPPPQTPPEPVATPGPN
jgi:penicillin-binding protein 1A